MPGRSFDDVNAFHRMMRTFAATKVGVALFRPTAHHLDQLASKLTGGRRSFAGIVTGVPAVMLTTIGAKLGNPALSRFSESRIPRAWLSSHRTLAAKSTRPGTTISRPTHKPLYVSRAIPGMPWHDPLHPASVTRSGQKASNSIPAGESTKRGPADATSRRSSSVGFEALCTIGCFRDMPLSRHFRKWPRQDSN